MIRRKISLIIVPLSILGDIYFNITFKLLTIKYLRILKIKWHNIYFLDKVTKMAIL